MTTAISMQSILLLLSLKPSRWKLNSRGSAPAVDWTFVMVRRCETALPMAGVMSGVADKQESATGDSLLIAMYCPSLVGYGKEE